MAGWKLFWWLVERLWKIYMQIGLNFVSRGFSRAQVCKATLLLAPAEVGVLNIALQTKVQLKS